MSPTLVYDHLAYDLGERRTLLKDLPDYVAGNYHRCLQVIEALYKATEGTKFAAQLTNTVEAAIYVSEVDLGISWQPPVFVKSGALLLDGHLVNQPLSWLSDQKYKVVREPFEKGLSHYLEAANKPARLADVVTDMYEAVEALARITTGRDRDLSGNREMFVSSLGVSDYYKGLLKNYVDYANRYRHAERQLTPRPPLSEPEVEAFIYLTGVFIRLAIQST